MDIGKIMAAGKVALLQDKGEMQISGSRMTPACQGRQADLD